MKIVIVHDWIVTAGGAERVLKELCSIYPDADLYTLICKEDSLKKLGIESRYIQTSFLQSIPIVTSIYRYLLPLMPVAVESFDLTDYDLVISSSHCVAKGVLTHSKQIHIAYVHTPMRYAWEQYHSYLKHSGLHKGLMGLIAQHLLNKIRIWDLTTSNRPDYYIANSYCVSRRIKKIYGKESFVIYPPVDTEVFKYSGKKEDFYITAGRLVAYKRVDLIVEAFSRMPDRKLLIIGEGPELKKIKSKATKNIEILPYQDEIVLADYLSRARAFIFAAEEDFGILTVEAQACGSPVIAYRAGGATETVIDGVTGVFFDKQSSESIIEAVKKFEKIENSFSIDNMRKNAEKFSRQRFKEEIVSFINSVICRNL